MTRLTVRSWGLGRGTENSSERTLLEPLIRKISDLFALLSVQ